MKKQKPTPKTPVVNEAQAISLMGRQKYTETRKSELYSGIEKK